MEYVVILASVADEETKTADVMRFLREYGLFRQVDMQYEPLVRIGFRGGKPAFHSPKNEELFERVLAAGPRGVLCVTGAPHAVMMQLDGQNFLHGEKVICIKYRPARPQKGEEGYEFPPPKEGLCGAYARRLVTLEPGNHDAGYVSASDRDFPDEGHALIVNPGIATLDRKSTEELVKRMTGIGRQGSFLLPPVFTAGPNDSYYADSTEAPRYETRQDLARTCDIDLHNTDEPTAITMWRLLDHESIRDILLEGGALRIVRPEDPVRTTLSLSVFVPHVEADPDPVRGYRNRVLYDPESLPAPSWGHSIASAFCDDLERSIPVGKDGLVYVKMVKETKNPVSWLVGPLAESRRGQPRGNWDNFVVLQERLSRREYRDYFNDQVLWPARDSDHNLAERQFIENFWRCPWTSDAGIGPWRLVMGGDLIQPGHDLRAGVQPVAKRYSRWSDRPMPRLSGPREKGYYVLEHSNAAGDKVLQWRLLLPIGTLICKNQIFRVGSGRLNKGYVLAD